MEDTEREGPVSVFAAEPAEGGGEDDTFAERPELLVGAAFAGGLALAGLLRWLDR
jgi:hypothetical protein